METATVLNISPMQWMPLKDIDEVAPLNDNDTECLKEIRDVLLRHNKIDRFGVALIHKHFDMQDDEVLMEYCDPENRCLTIQPMKTGEEVRSIQTLWKLNADGNKPLAACYQQCEVNIHGNHMRRHL